MSRGVQGDVCRVAILLVWLCSAVGGHAQGPPPEGVGAPEPPGGSAAGSQYTLHVYTNLIQIPVLVLSPARERLGHVIDPGRFAFNIDSGPWYRPTHVRPEGNDPISLSILLDPGGDASGLMRGMDAAIASLAPGLLHDSDHVTLYGLDCELVRAGGETAAAANTLVLREQVHAALERWRRRTASHGRCAEPISPEEALRRVIEQMQDASGRRVLVVITQSEDDLDKIYGEKIAQLAQMNGTAIFAITPQSAAQQIRMPRGGLIDVARRANTLDRICQDSGGTLVSTSTGQIARTLAKVVQMIRERYIIEFPRASNATAGRHVLTVRVDKMNAYIRTAGTSLPLEDPDVMNQPTTVRPDTTLAPIQGNQAPKPN